jgi:anti-anti-sigma factor
LGQGVDDLRRTFDDAMEQGDTRFAVNLDEVSMIDSSGIGLLVRYLASTKQNGGSLKLVKPSPFAVKTLRLVGVLNLFEIFDDDDTAVESFT